jgi:hypothetical protein
MQHGREQGQAARNILRYDRAVPLRYSERAATNQRATADFVDLQAQSAHAAACAPHAQIPRSCGPPGGLRWVKWIGQVGPLGLSKISHGCTKTSSAAASIRVARPLLLR